MNGRDLPLPLNMQHSIHEHGGLIHLSQISQSPSKLCGISQQTHDTRLSNEQCRSDLLIHFAKAPSEVSTDPTTDQQDLALRITHLHTIPFAGACGIHCVLRQLFETCGIGFS